MGFKRESVERVGMAWDEVEPQNAALERLQQRRVMAVRPEGDTASSKAVWKIRCFQQLILHRVVMLAEGCSESWNTDSPIVSILCARAIIETSALEFDFQKKLEEFCREGNFVQIDDLVMNRNFGTRIQDWQDTGAGFPAVNVLTVIDSMDREMEGVRRHYNLLSEICHPNSLGMRGVFGALEAEARTLHLSPRTSINQGILDLILGGFFLIVHFEELLNTVDGLLPRVFELSERERLGEARED